MQSIRPAACAGTFYPGRAAELSRWLSSALIPAATSPTPKALIVPHAGYVYSGPIAASAYSLLAGANIERVVLLGPAHRLWFRGVALPEADEFATPLGRIGIDQALAQRISPHRQIINSGPAHAAEHSLEVQLPFLQSVLKKFTLLPLLLGEVEAGTVADILQEIWGGPETLIVVSSDLSHYLDYVQAGKTDSATVRRILELDATLGHDQACGATPINALLNAAKAKRLEPKLLDCRNSGDTAGGRERVVGYASFAFYQESNHAD